MKIEVATIAAVLTAAAQSVCAEQDVLGLWAQGCNKPGALPCGDFSGYALECSVPSYNQDGQCQCAPGSPCEQATKERSTYGDHGIESGKCNDSRKCKGHAQSQNNGKPASLLKCVKINPYYSQCQADAGPAPGPTPAPTTTPGPAPGPTPAPTTTSGPTPAPTTTPAPGGDVLGIWAQGCHDSGALPCGDFSGYPLECSAPSSNPRGQCVCAPGSPCEQATKERQTYGDHGIEYGACSDSRKCKGHGQSTTSGKPAPLLKCVELGPYNSQCRAAN